MFLSVDCAKPPVDWPPELNSWLTVHENEYTFGDGCVVSVQESKNACHSLQVESGRCNKVYRSVVERTWLTSKHPNARVVERPDITFVDSARRINFFAIKTEDGDQVSVCFDVTGLW